MADRHLRMVSKASPARFGADLECNGGGAVAAAGGDLSPVGHGGRLTRRWAGVLLGDVLSTSLWQSGASGFMVAFTDISQAG